MNPMISQILSLPGLIREVVPMYSDGIRKTLDKDLCNSIHNIYLTGCGDSHHASIGSSLAFAQLTGVKTEAMTSMQFARYTADSLPDAEHSLVIGTSVSGEVSRTLEGLLLARKAKAKALAITATSASRIARSANLVVDTTSSPYVDTFKGVIPGMRSFVINQLALMLIAVHIGEQRGQLSTDEKNRLTSEIYRLGDAADDTIQKNSLLAQELARNWVDADEFVFCGSGPNFASALFSAAKILEASGDPAMGQDLEEWAHLQYFAKKQNTPTFILTAADRDASRAKEIIVAARTIGRRVAVIAPISATELLSKADAALPLPNGVREIFSPVILSIPASLFAAYRAEELHEPYFRDFLGGRSVEGGGGISQIRTSQTLGLELLE